MNSIRQRPALPGLLAILLAGCAPELSPTPELLAADFPLAGRATRELEIAPSLNRSVFVTIRSPDVDLRLAELPDAGAPAANCDAPNRRMGVETLLLEKSPAIRTLRVSGNDHGQAHGQVSVRVIALPETTEDDRRWLAAAQSMSDACLSFAEPARRKDAASAYDRAAEMFSALRDREYAGIAFLQAAGVQYQPLANWALAASDAKHAADQLHGADAKLLEAYALRLRGAALHEQSQSGTATADDEQRLLSEARGLLSNAVSRFIELDAQYQAGYAYNYRGASHHATGERTLAKRDYEHALRQFQLAGDRPAQALSLQSLALLAHEEGRVNDAVAQFDEALDLIPRDEDVENYAHTLYNSGLPLRVLGRFDEALSRFHESGQLLRERGDRIGEARALHAIGVTFRYSGDLQRARQFLQAAIELRGDNAARREQADSLVVLGQIERGLGDPERAVAMHRRALDLVAAPNDQARSLLALAQDLVAVGEFAGARRELDRLLTLDLPAGNRHLGQAWTELGALAAHNGDADGAAKAFATAIGIHERNGSEFELAGALVQRAEAMLARGQVDDASADSARALELYADIGGSDTASQARSGFLVAHRSAAEARIEALVAIAERERRRGNGAEAQARLAEAFAASDRFRGDRPSVERLQAIDRIAGLRDRQERLLARAQPDEGELAEVRRELAWLRAESGSTATRTGTADKQERAGPRDLSIESLPQDVRIVEYFLGDRHSWLFDARRDRIEVHVLPPRSLLEREARDLITAWSSRARGDAPPLARGERIGRMLFGPLRSSGATPRLLLVPDGALHLLPLPVLLHDTASPPIAESTVIIPSWNAAQARRPDQRSIASAALGIVSDPIYNADDPRIPRELRVALSTDPERVAEAAGPRLGASANYSRLSSAAAEARAIASFALGRGGVALLEGQDATRDKVLRLLATPHRVVHFATHARADTEDPALATLALSRLTSAGPVPAPDLRYAEIARLRIRADLVVLSACETFIGREIYGAGPIGLSNAFLQAGASSVISTLWMVPDTATAAFMREFYRELLQNAQPPEVALRQAQREMQRSKRWSDPYYWAGFQLVTITGF